MSLRFIMLGALAPLVLLLAFFLEQDLAKLAAARAEQLRLVSVVAETDALADLVHELQKERGYSAGFIASRRANFSVEIVKQRQDTDAALRAYRGAITMVIWRPSIFGNCSTLACSSRSPCTRSRTLAPSS